jgi:hypothetical protein
MKCEEGRLVLPLSGNSDPYSLYDRSYTSHAHPLDGTTSALDGASTITEGRPSPPQ